MNQGSTHVPAGFKWELRGKQLVIICPKCNRKWKGDRVPNPQNRAWLEEHLRSHTETFNEYYMRIGATD